MIKVYCEINFFTANFRESQCTVQPAKSDSDAMSSLQNYQGLIVRPVKRDWAVLSKDTPVDISMSNSVRQSVFIHL